MGGRSLRESISVMYSMVNVKEGIGFLGLGVDLGLLCSGSSALVVSFVNSLLVLVEYLIYLLYHFGSYF